MSLPAYPDYKESGVAWLGGIPTHWVIYRLKDITSVINGFPFDSKLFDPEGICPLLRIRDLDATKTSTYYNGQFLSDFSVTSSDILVGMDGDFNVGRWRGQGTAQLC
ncbi:hypothetical protein [Acetobacter malorum]|uniref:hypothetical protein n=1 Tax=Acetobacter malorum TaxID=178901 RepID=UPI000ACFDC48|nr:hypothetical protein [Acetobacter malorum]